MSRPREFDTESVLDSVVELFWDQGYEATSVTDIEGATGLSRSSLYQAFGNKRGLYQAALERYRERQVVPALAAMAAPGAGVADLRTYLGILGDMFRGDPRLAMRGCFLVNSVTELGGIDQQVREAGLAYRKAVADAMANALRGGPRSDLQRDRAAERASTMSATLIGALVTAHFDPDGAAGICLQMIADLNDNK